MRKLSYFIAFLLLALHPGLQARRVGCEALPLSLPAWSLDAGAKKLAVAFRPDEDMEARVLAAAFEGSVPSPAIKFSLYTGAEAPRDLLGSSQSVVPSGSGWASAPLQPVTLKGGASYFLVIEADPNRGGVHAVEQTSAQLAAHVTLRSGLSANTERALAFDGKRWSRLRGSPLWAVQGAAGLALGQAYDNAFTRPIYKGRSQGQTFHFDCGTTPTLLRARIRAQGKPSAPLLWALQRHNYMVHLTETVMQATLVPADRASQDWAWVQVTLPTSIGSLAPECHYFALSSESGAAEDKSCNDCWEVSGARVLGGLSSSQDLSDGGGAHRDRATSGVDLKHWDDDYDADLNLQVDGNDCPTSKFQTPALRLLERPRSLLQGVRP